MNSVDKDLYMLKSAEIELINATDAANDKSWKFHKKLDNKIDVYTKNSGNGCVCVCGIGRIFAEPNEIMTEIKNRKQWKKWDPLLYDVEFLEVSEDQRIIHAMFNGIPPLLTARDVVFYEQQIKKKKENTYMFVSSATSTNFYPPTKDYVRAELIHAGWHIVHLNKNECLVTYYINIDLKLQLIPQQIINIFATRFPSIIKKIEEIIYEHRV